MCVVVHCIIDLCKDCAWADVQLLQQMLLSIRIDTLYIAQDLSQQSSRTYI